MARKLSTTVDALPGLRLSYAAALEAAQGSGESLKAAEKAADAAWQAYLDASLTLAAERRAAGDRLAMAVAAELEPLKLASARFRVSIEPLDETRAGPSGMDRVAFEISTNPGMPPGPLDKIASGGELARFMLALKVVLAGSQERAVLIFDEVDAGISGATANAVGERLARLAKNVQVIVVTHAPQVAARGDNHWRVSKATRAGQTSTKVEQLSTTARREEIARMLAGEKITDEARAAADSLLSGPLS
jgi:DNA repair protein RecN (Recombination protein N)